MGKINKIAPSKLFIPGANSNELSYVFIEPAGEHENGSRFVFGMFQVKDVSELYHSIIALTVKNIIDYFQKTPASIGNHLNEDALHPAEFIFENALQYANDQLINTLTEQGEHDRLDPKKISMVIGMVWDNELYVSSLGNDLNVFYLYPVQKKDSFSHYNAISVLNDNDESSDGSAARMFSNITSGSVAIPESTLVVCNRSFVEYISLDQIKQAVTSYDHDRVTPYFQNLLGKANTHTDFAAVFLRMTGRAVQAPHRAGNHAQTVTQHSMDGLVTTEQDTEAILSPAFANQTKDMIISMSKKIILTPAKKIISLTVTRIKNISLPQASTVFKKEAIVQNLESTRAKLKDRSHTFIIAFHKLRKKNKQEILDTAVKIVREKGLAHGTALKEKLLALSPVSKAILVVAVIFLALFGVSIISQRAKQSDEKALKTYETLVANIGQQANLAEASLIYEDEEKSKSFLAEAQRLLATLPTTTLEQQKKRDELTQQLEVVKRKISHVLPLTTSVVAQLENQIPTLDQLKMTLVGETTVLHNRDSVYTLDVKNGKALQINTQAKVPQITCAVEYDASTAYLCGNEEGRLFELNLKDQSAQAVAIKNEKGMTIAAVTTYNKRLYFVDGTNGSIYRHGKLNDGFGSATILAKDLPELKNAQSIAIDGTIYVLANNNLLKVANQKATPIPLPVVEPAISAPTSLWTTDESNFLYISEPAQKRIIVIDKRSNKVKAQLVADNLDSIQSIVINEKKREILILNGSQILKAPIDFLK